MNPNNQPDSKTNGKAQLPIDKVFEPIDGSEDWTESNLDGSERELLLPEDLRQQLDLPDIDPDVESN